MQLIDTLQHDAARWGAEFTDEEPPREVVRLANLVKRGIDRVSPVRVAAIRVLNILLEARLQEWFLMRQGRRALALSDEDRWLKPMFFTKEGIRLGIPISYEWPWSHVRAADGMDHCDPEDVSVGRKGLAQCLRLSWTRLKTEDDLDEDLAARICILRADADRLFILPTVEIAVGAEAIDARVVQPIGGKWPHTAKLWSPAERDAMQSMRLNGMSDAEIGKVAGCSRQLVYDKIGARVTAHSVFQQLAANASR